MSKLFRPVVALCAAVPLMVALAACGDSVPGNSVAKVGDVDITKTTFDHWAEIANKQQASQSGAAATTKVPVPPDFTACIAEKKATAAKPAKGQPNPTDADYKKQCKTAYESLRDSVVSLLVNGEWIEGEAYDQGIKLSDDQVRKDLISQKQQSFPTDKAYNDFIKQTGYTTEDLLYRVKITDLTNSLRTKVTKGKDNVSDADLQSYYNKNKAQFGQPASRDLRIVLTKTPAKANAAKAAIEGGEDIKSVAKRLSTDTTSKNRGGLLSGVTQGQLEKQLDAAAFKAKKGVLTGPVKTQFGYYVFEVVKITKGTQQPFSAVKAQIKSIVQGQKQQDALNKFVKSFTKKWTAKTTCASGFKTTECKNGPKTTSTSTVAPGAVPQSSGTGADGTSQAPAGQ